ncbi:Peptide deformylase [Geodia barretti]|uniref:Peptide deformylase n=2 Tax=Geodia barretti TaxID=519541 RepID=A0AA35R531_GEOBA|nr:Peptide deformylase [Geodia barretti]
MIETMTEHNGVGLAANQVGVLERICVIQTPDMEEAMVLVNPEIVHREGEREVEEGCLSVPGYRGMVVRSESVRARALDLSSKIFKLEADELLAQALEHEIDHLNGIMYLDHLVAHTTVYKIVESTDGSEEDAKYEADGAGDDHGHDGHDHENGHEEHGHEHTHDPDFEALHQRLHEMRGDAVEPGPVESTSQQEPSA